MNLADCFPDDFKKQHFKGIDLGCAILIEIPEFNIEHRKYAIYFANDKTKEGHCGLVIINSDINENVNRSDYLKSQHVLIDCKRHTFLDYDSYVDCTQIHNHNLDEIIACIAENPNFLKGNVAEDVLKKIYDKILASRLISPKDKKKYSIL